MHPTALPWLAPTWAKLMAARRSGRVAQALLLAGPVGAGLSELARALTAALLCEVAQNPDGACGQCRGCHLHAAGNHPDTREASPQEGGRSLGIDLVRDLNGFVVQTRQLAPHKVVLMESAERLTSNAANAALKILEEPPAGVIWVLTTPTPGRLPVTIRSRCQLWRLGAPTVEEAADWLAGQGHGSEVVSAAMTRFPGRPLDAARWLSMAAQEREPVESVRPQVLELLRGRGDAFTLADALAAHPDRLDELVRVLGALTRMRVAGGDGVPAELARMLARRSAGAWLALYDEAIRLRVEAAAGQVKPVQALDGLLAALTDAQVMDNRRG